MKMSKAEDRALEAYPKETRDIDGNIVAIGYPQYMRDLYIEGYHQAEKDINFDFLHGMQEYKEKIDNTSDKDLEIAIENFEVEKNLALTWEDIPKIFQISEELKTSWWFRDNEQTKLIGTQVFWEEVLKRFKDYRERKRHE